MKKYLTLLCSLFSLIAAGQQIDAKNLEQKNGIYYQLGKNIPFTGQTISYHDNGNKEMVSEYKDGKIHGKFQGWYPSGKMQAEGSVINEQKAGLWIAWHENGNKLREGRFENGKEEGEYTWWFENGNINKKGMYHDGISDGKWEWYYENGQIEQQGILKGDTNDGTWTTWYENGAQKMTGTFINGVKNGDWIWWDEKGKITTKKKYKDGLPIGGTDNLDTYLEKMEFFLKEKDFKAALSNIEKAIATIEDKSENNKVYMELVVYHANVYATFHYLDEAETVMLKATGLPENDIKAIVKTNYPPAKAEFKVLAKKISEYPEMKTKIGPHVALALLYNVLGDSIRLGAEQQLMMERSDTSDWVIQISMGLYKIRGIKENIHGEILFLKEEITKTGETEENQMQLANDLLQIGKFTEADTIVNKYLAKKSDNINWLYLKAGIEMAWGNVENVNEYKKRVLAIEGQKK